MKIKPLFDYVLIKPIKEEIQDGFVVPQTSQKQNIGEVLAVGDGSLSPNLTASANWAKSRSPMIVKIGQKVIFDSSINYERVHCEGEELLLVSQFNIIANIED